MRNNKKRDQYPDRSKNTALMLLVNTGKPDGAKLECKRPTLLFVFLFLFFLQIDPKQGFIRLNQEILNFTYSLHRYCTF